MTPRHVSHRQRTIRNAPGKLRLGRRELIVGALASGLLVACGDSGDESNSEFEDFGGNDGGDEDTYTLVQRFPQGMQVPGELRLPISLSTGLAELVQDGPDELGARVLDLDGNPVGEPITARRRDVVPGPYYDFRPVVETPGFYALVVDGGPEGGANFDVADPATVPVPIPGQPLPPFDTPTFDDPAGVDPVCTLQPPCPFHEVTLADALAAGGPVAYLVGTPAFCATGTCAPALEAMVDLAPRYDGQVTFVHAEVYTDDTATTVAPAVDAVSMTYEPAVFLTDADGLVVERLDAVWDVTELTDALERSVVA